MGTVRNGSTGWVGGGDTVFTLSKVRCRLDGGIINGCFLVWRGLGVRRVLFRSRGGNGIGFSSLGLSKVAERWELPLVRDTKVEQSEIYNVKFRWRFRLDVSNLFWIRLDFPGRNCGKRPEVYPLEPFLQHLRTCFLSELQVDWFSGFLTDLWSSANGNINNLSIVRNIKP